MRQLIMWNTLSFSFPSQPGDFSFTGELFFQYFNVLLDFEVLLGFIKSR